MSYLEKLDGRSIAVVGMGYVGSHLFEFLSRHVQESNIDVVAVNRQNFDVLMRREFDYVFNCAGNTGDFWREPVATVEANIHLNAQLLENCRINEALLSLSSTRIYGFTKDPTTVFTEDSFACQPHTTLNSLYDSSKKLMECLMLNTPKDYRKIVVRLSNVYGGFQLSDLDDSTFLKMMLRHAYEHKKFFVKQNLNSTKDYIFVDDAIEGILRSAIFAEADDIFNICSGKSDSVLNWTNFLNIEVETDPTAEPVYSNLSNEKAARALGFWSKKKLSDLSLDDVIRFQ